MSRDSHQKQSLALVKLGQIARQGLPLLNLKNIVRATWEENPHFVIELRKAISEVMEEDVTVRGDQPE
jgi:hypothetical protein